MFKGKNVLETFREAKKNADYMWDQAFKAALNGDIDKERLGICMMICNKADAAFFEEECRVAERKRLLEERREKCID